MKMTFAHNTDKIIAAVGAGVTLFGAAFYAVDRPDVTFHVISSNYEPLKDYPNTKVYVFANFYNSPSRIVFKTGGTEWLKEDGYDVTPLHDDNTRIIITQKNKYPLLPLRDACMDSGAYTEVAYEKPSWMMPGYTHRGTKRFYWHEYM